MIPAEQTYEFLLAPVSLMGVGCHGRLPAEVRRLNFSRPLLVTDEGVTKARITRKILRLLKREASLEPPVFDAVVANPTVAVAEAGLAAFQEHQCDSIITVGGGSVHDTGKAIGILATSGGALPDYEGFDKLAAPIPPMIAVNTTAGTAAETTRFCIITDPGRKRKMVIADRRATPAVAVNDPLLMVSLPADLTAQTGMDALSHAIEAYVSPWATPMTDACALEAIRLIEGNLRACVANGKDLAARDRMAYAQYLAGMAFNSAGVGHVHTMAHQLGGRYNLPHGLCNAVLLPHVQQRNMLARLDRFVDIARAMGQVVDGRSRRDAARLALDAVRALNEDIGIHDGLRALGVEADDLARMAQDALTDPCGATNPRPLSEDEITDIYREAL